MLQPVLYQARTRNVFMLLAIVGDQATKLPTHVIRHSCTHSQLTTIFKQLLVSSWISKGFPKDFDTRPLPTPAGRPGRLLRCRLSSAGDRQIRRALKENKGKSIKVETFRPKSTNVSRFCKRSAQNRRMYRVFVRGERKRRCPLPKKNKMT